MNILKKSNENQDRFIFHRSNQQETLNYFQMKEQLEELPEKDDKMVVDVTDDAGSNAIAYNALLQSEILDLGELMGMNYLNQDNENIPSSLT